MVELMVDLKERPMVEMTVVSWESTMADLKVVLLVDSSAENSADLKVVTKVAWMV